MKKESRNSTYLESEEKFRTVIESIEDGYFEVDQAGNLTFCNDSMSKLLGYAKDEIGLKF